MQCLGATNIQKPVASTGQSNTQPLKVFRSPVIRVVHRMNHGPPPLHQSIHPHAVWLEAPPAGIVSNEAWLIHQQKLDTVKGLKKCREKYPGYILQ